jgi:hypothetical protein
MNGDNQTTVAANVSQAEAIATIDAQHRAAADPLPGPALAAFLPKPVNVGPFTIRRLVANDMALLQDIESPILPQYCDNTKPGKNGLPPGWHLYDMWVLIWLFTNPPKVCRDFYLANGKDAFIAKAVAEIGDREDLTMAILGETTRKVMESVRRSTETAQAVGADPAPVEDGEKKSPVTPVN